jgi:hypothetical protein
MMSIHPATNRKKFFRPSKFKRRTKVHIFEPFRPIR